jgi:hypothetical protein
MENNIRIDVMEIGWENVDSIHLALNRDHDNESPGSINGRLFHVYLRNYQFLKLGLCSMELVTSRIK